MISYLNSVRGLLSRYTRKGALTLLVVGAAAGLHACTSGSGSTEQETTAVTAKAVPSFSVVFLDKSVSVNTQTPFVQDKYRQAVQQIVENNIRRAGDKIWVYFVHENTSKAKALELTATATMEDTEGMNATDAEAARTEFDLLLKKERKQFQEQLLRQLALVNRQTSNQATDLWASLSVVNRIAQEEGNVKVYYFSDMIESVKGDNRRDFHTRPPAGSQEAQAWAQQDARIVKKQLDPERLESVKVHLILPFEPTSSVKENNPAVTEYWEELFSSLGIKQSVQEL